MRIQARAHRSFAPLSPFRLRLRIALTCRGAVEAEGGGGGLPDQYSPTNHVKETSLWNVRICKDLPSSSPDRWGRANTSFTNTVNRQRDIKETKRRQRATKRCLVRVHVGRPSWTRTCAGWVNSKENPIWGGCCRDAGPKLRPRREPGWLLDNDSRTT